MSVCVCVHMSITNSWILCGEFVHVREDWWIGETTLWRYSLFQQTSLAIVSPSHFPLDIYIYIYIYIIYIYIIGNSITITHLFSYKYIYIWVKPLIRIFPVIFKTVLPIEKLTKGQGRRVYLL